MVFGICLVFCFLLTAVVFGQENIPTITLPISSLLEVRKDLIRKEGNAFPGGWSKYYVDYKSKTWHFFYGKESSPFDGVYVCPFTLEMLWVETLMFQDRNFESDEWAEKHYRDWSDSRILEFHIFLCSKFLNLLAKEDLQFIYQDSTGARKNGVIYFYELEETKEPEYSVEIGLGVYLPSNPQDITWFSLHILNKRSTERVDMRWDFKKD